MSHHKSQSERVLFVDLSGSVHGQEREQLIGVINRLVNVGPVILIGTSPPKSSISLQEWIDGQQAVLPEQMWHVQTTPLTEDPSPMGDDFPTWPELKAMFPRVRHIDFISPCFDLCPMDVGPLKAYQAEFHLYGNSSIKLQDRNGKPTWVSPLLTYAIGTGHDFNQMVGIDKSVLGELLAQYPLPAQEQETESMTHDLDLA